MNRKAFSGITVLTLLLISTLTLAFNIQPVKGWTGTVYIRADGCIDPADAPLKTLDNLTYTMTDDIESSTDGVVVERDNITIAGAGHRVQGTIQVTAGFPNRGIVLDGRHNITIRDVEIKNFSYGIYLYESSGNNISGNNITNNLWGISLSWSSNHNSISGNTFSNDGLVVEDSYENVVADNYVNGKPLVYLEGASDLVVDGAGQIILVDSVNITVEGLNLSSTSVGIELLGTNNTKITGNNITNSTFGIYLSCSSNNIISGNNITNNSHLGVGLGSSSNNIISGNNITNNDYGGIYLYESSGNNISGNNITNNLCGMSLDSSSNNILRNNSMVNNTYNFGVLSQSLAGYVNDVDASNTVDGKPIYYWVNKRDMTVPLDAGYIALINCTNITVKNLDLKNNIADLLLAYTTNSTITQNNMTNSWYRLHIGVAGIYLYESSGNSISGNNITNNDVGIFLRHSSNNTISGNNIAANTWYSIWLEYSSNNNSISRNNITNNDVGIYLYESSGNNISGNNITNNLWVIWLQHSSNNNIYHNNFINNTYQVSSEFDSVNVWDNGYPSGGNYWSNYTDVDLYYGSYQNQTGSDGIWDHPYIIDHNNRDRYPLVNPWTPISTYVQGIDVSHHQGNINWSKVHDAGYRFAFVKATGGVSFIDPSFTANIEQASEAGLIVGAYHFAYPEYNDAVSEAQHFLSVAGNYMRTGYLRPVLDLEDDPNENSYPYRMGKDNLTNWVHTWMNTVKNETGIEPIIYTGWYARVGDYLGISIAQYDLWIAHYTYDPTLLPDTGIWDRWDFWQYSDKGSVLGIVGNVDLDLFNGDLQRLRREFIVSNARTLYVSWEDKTYPITILSNSSVTHLIFNQSLAQISFKISGETGLQGYCNITIPKSLIKGEPWTVKINGTTIDFQSTSNQTHSFIYFTYTFASTLEVTIQGTWVIPEFPQALIPSLFMVLSILLIATTKRRFPTKPKHNG